VLLLSALWSTGPREGDNWALRLHGHLVYETFRLLPGQFAYTDCRVAHYAYKTAGIKSDV